MIIPWTMASDSFGKTVCMILKASGNIASPKPWITLATIKKEKFIANLANNVPITYNIIKVKRISFFPKMIDNFDATGVITAPAIKYELNIQDESEYVILNSLIISGIAGIIIVSPAVEIKFTEPRIKSINHAICGILFHLVFLSMGLDETSHSLNFYGIISLYK